MKGLRILKAFLDAMAENSEADLYGRDIMKRARIFSGTLYPLLIKFEQQGLLTSAWEQIDPSVEGRPARRLYRMTPLGEQVTRAVLAELQMPGWVPDHAVPGGVKR